MDSHVPAVFQALLPCASGVARRTVTVYPRRTDSFMFSKATVKRFDGNAGVFHND